MSKPTQRPRGLMAIVRYFDREYWQMREALAYPMPYWVQRRWPRQFQDGGTNPHVCGICEARRRYPELHNRQPDLKVTAHQSQFGETT